MSVGRGVGQYALCTSSKAEMIFFRRYISVCFSMFRSTILQSYEKIVKSVSEAPKKLVLNSINVPNRRLPSPRDPPRADDAGAHRLVFGRQGAGARKDCGAATAGTPGGARRSFLSTTDFGPVRRRSQSYTEAPSVLSLGYLGRIGRVSRYRAQTAFS